MLKKLCQITLLFTSMLLLTYCNLEEVDSLEATIQENAEQQTTEIANSRGREVIPNKYIVVLKDDPSLIDRIERVKNAANGLANKHGFSRDSIKQVYGKVFQGFSTDLNPGQLRKLSSDKAVDYIVPDKVIALAPNRKTPTLLKQYHGVLIE